LKDWQLPSLLLIGAGSGVYLFTKKVPGLDRVQTDFELSADDLFLAFETDESAATQMYENRVILVSGKVQSVSEDGLNLILATNNGLMGGINCSFPAPLKAIQVGEQIQVKGLCQGFLMDVILTNCLISSNE
jgi:hypothetical protein